MKKSDEVALARAHWAQAQRAASLSAVALGIAKESQEAIVAGFRAMGLNYVAACDLYGELLVEQFKAHSRTWLRYLECDANLKEALQAA